MKLSLFYLLLCVAILIFIFPYNAYLKYPRMIDELSNYEKRINKLSKKTIAYYLCRVIYYIIILIYDFFLLFLDIFFADMFSLYFILYSIRLIIYIILFCVIIGLINIICLKL